MTGNFSLVAASKIKEAGQKFSSGSAPGLARGTSGVTGSMELAGPRDVDAGESKERSLVFQQQEKRKVKLPFTSRRIRALQAAGVI